LGDGPLAFDNAISPDAARTKGVASPVAGNADILLVPDLEAGNMLAKQLVYFADAIAAGRGACSHRTDEPSRSAHRANCLRRAGEAGCRAAAASRIGVGMAVSVAALLMMV
jgi:Phosphate acetyl/butaryl transferase